MTARDHDTRAVQALRQPGGGPGAVQDLALKRVPKAHEGLGTPMEGLTHMGGARHVQAAASEQAGHNPPQVIRTGRLTGAE